MVDHRNVTREFLCTFSCLYQLRSLVEHIILTFRHHSKRILNLLVFTENVNHTIRSQTFSLRLFSNSDNHLQVPISRVGRPIEVHVTSYTFSLNRTD